MVTNFDNIVFDLGGVVIDLDRSRCINAFNRLGYADIAEDLGLYVQKGAFFNLETGKISTSQFFDEIRSKCTAKEVTDSEIEEAFNQFLVALPIERLRAIHQLRKSKRTYMLSNTNAVMYNSWIDNAFRQDGLSVNDYFDGTITSFQEGYCKPHPQIFNALLQKFSLDGSKTIFLDDSERNCEAARECGIHARCVTPDDDILSIIKELQ